LTGPFDKRKYKRLLKGLEVVELSLSSLERTKRIDSEFYRKVNLSILNILNKAKHTPLTDFFMVSDGNHMSISDDFRQEGIKYYRGADIYNFFIEDASPVCISEEMFNRSVMKRSHLAEGDILMSIVGIIGNISLVRTSAKQTCSCKLAILRPKKSVSSSTVAVYLKTQYAQNQIQKFKRGTVQTGFLLEDADQILMPLFTDRFCGVIEKSVSNINTIILKATMAYSSAERLLLAALGLQYFTPSSEPVAIKSFSESFGATGRLDAEYYQKKYDSLFSALSKLKCDKLGNFVKIAKSIEPGSEYYSDDGIPFVRVSDITKFGIQEPEIKIPASLTDLRPCKNTILLSKDGSVGIAYKVEQNMDVITSGALLHLNITGDVLPDYLTLILNSIVVQFQAERDAGGSIIQHWKPSEIKQVIIPILDIAIQQQITADIQRSFALRRQSENLLDTAKRAVEIAIERGEDAAIEWLDGEMRGYA